MYNNARQRAKRKGMEFDLSPCDVIIPPMCPILHIPLVVYKGSSGGRPNSPSLDRIDNNKGYILGNVWVISSLANMMKNAASPSELRRFAHWVMLAYPFTVET